MVFIKVYNQIESGKLENSQNLLDKTWLPGGDCQGRACCLIFRLSRQWQLFLKQGETEPQGFLVFIYLFIFGCVGSSLLRIGFLQLWRAGATLCCGAWASHCGAFSLRSTGSRHAGFSSCGLRALECRLSSCGARALLLCSMWDLPGPGLEPVSPALAGGFLTAAPPEKTPEPHGFIGSLY